MVFFPFFFFFFLKSVCQIWEHTWYGLAQKRKNTMRWRRIWIGLINKWHYYQAPQETPALKFIQPAPLATHSLWTVGYLKRASSGQTLMLSLGPQWGSSAPLPSLQHAWELQRCLPLLGFQIRNAASGHTALISKQSLPFFEQSWNKTRVETFLPPAPLLVSAPAASITETSTEDRICKNTSYNTACLCQQ